MKKCRKILKRREECIELYKLVTKTLNNRRHAKNVDYMVSVLVIKGILWDYEYLFQEKLRAGLTTKTAFDH